MKTRFAPSPTGWLHFGNLRTALFNYLFAKHNNAQFLLRIEDTDRERSQPQYIDEIKTDLKWLGMEWDNEAAQSQRADVYAEYYSQLEERGHAYKCFCSQETLELMRKSQLSQGKPPRYSGTCRNLSAEEIEQKLNAGEKPTLRFKMEKDQYIEFVDLIKGKQKFASSDIGDFIIRRNCGGASFMFCNAIDDSLMDVTHALRGDDHITNTPRQLVILRALGLREPEYGHFAMINGTDGSPLSKRNGSAAVRDLREQGYHPLAVANYLARLGHYYEQNKLYPDLQSLSKDFGLDKASTSPARHDMEHFKHWQKEAIINASASELAKMLHPYISAVPESKINAFIDLIRDNILMPHESALWAEAFCGKLDLIEHKDLLSAAGAEFYLIAADALGENFDYQSLITSLKNKTDKKGKNLFMPLRVALTGSTHGPELEKVMQFLGKDLALQRLKEAKNII